MYTNRKRKIKEEKEKNKRETAHSLERWSAKKVVRTDFFFLLYRHRGYFHSIRFQLQRTMAPGRKNILSRGTDQTGRATSLQISNLDSLVHPATVKHAAYIAPAPLHLPTKTNVLARRVGGRFLRPSGLAY